MKTIQPVLKANIKASIIMLLLLMIGATSCSKNDESITKPTVTITPEEEEIILSDEKQITEFKFLAAENIVLTTDVISTIDINAKTIIVNLPSDIPLTALTPKISISPKAIVSPTGEKDFTDAVTYTVTAEDGTTSSYSVTATSTSSAKEITSFRFTGIENNGVTVDIPGEIDEEGKTIALEMPNGTEITTLEPELEIPDNAIYEPTGPQDFSSPINYTVTAEDGTSRTYLVTVDVLLSQKEILLIISEVNPSNTLNWNESDNPSEWDEVTLDGNGDIIELTMNFRGLIILPPEIGQLRSLEVLLLANMPSLSRLPPEIGQLSNLKKLHAEVALTSLPPEIGQLIKLESLNINFNYLSSLPPEIGQLINLKELNLRNNRLSSLPLEIWQLNSLEELSLSTNNLNSIPPEIGQLTKLESLSLGHNQLTSLPTEIKQLVNLKSLSVSNNNLSEFNHVPFIPSGSNSNILNCSTETNLLKLYLSGNPNLTAISQCICDLDVANGGAVEIDVVPDEVACVDNNVISN
ncbi:leucine-rich repeat domain-containing protein [uncultured Maribacter sp.]|uniref:leucine-rich repeat domain-containing protein n=1 Tax=uncultured Maribacter sp. TaxID=431308 RepID=UPI0030EC668B|tara:strand:+ start:14990 stop:16558 length:1569 start_codon:yes stop_codon:yes gene_type:complete